MLVVDTISQLRSFLAQARAEGKRVGLVPTMGALHEGHASLVERSVKENGVTVVSVFVNPTQFNDKGDLERYPRTLEADCQLLERLGASCVFAPSVEEVYPEEDTRVFDFPPRQSGRQHLCGSRTHRYSRSAQESFGLPHKKNPGISQ